MPKLDDQSPEPPKSSDREQADSSVSNADLKRNKKIRLRLILESSCEEYEESEKSFDRIQLSQELIAFVENVSFEKLEPLYSVYQLSPEEALRKIKASSGKRMLMTVRPTALQLVNGAIWLYLSSLRQFLPTVLLAVLWFPGCLLVVALLEDLLIRSANQGSGLTFFVLPFSLALIGFSLAKSFALATAIGKMAFARLTHAPLSMAQARRFTARRKGGFLLINLVPRLCIGLTSYILLSLAQLVFAEPFELGFEIMALGIFPLILLGMAFLWLMARFAVADLPLATQENSSAIASFETAWQLTNGQAKRILWAMAGLALVIFPPLIYIRNVIFQISDSLLINLPDADSTLNLALSIALLHSHLIVIGILAIPFWQSLRALIYYDLLQPSQAQPLVEMTLMEHSHSPNPTIF